MKISPTLIRRQPPRGGDSLFYGERRATAVALNQICVSDESTPGPGTQPTENSPFQIAHRLRSFSMLDFEFKANCLPKLFAAQLSNSMM
ncbi:unnamed protein product [Citrullus colocynthis]|uniref:Uncharacterized protein n=1 Tax=Citrullus colocynthis TaxID=252529 RepID=A0ABP0YBH5_9ROSI